MYIKTILNNYSLENKKSFDNLIIFHSNRYLDKSLSAYNVEKSINLGEDIEKTPAEFVASLATDEEVAAYYRVESSKKEETFQERVVQIRRVTKVVKGGKQLSFRAVVVIGNENGLVGVGVASAKEVIVAVAKAITDARKFVVSVPLTKNQSIPQRIESHVGASRVILRPASEGTGVVAGGATRVVLELAGLKNIFGKQLGADNPLNNSRATLAGLKALRHPSHVAKCRGISQDQLLGKEFSN
jgi:small subunit ribosomal protein S5